MSGQENILPDSAQTATDSIAVIIPVYNGARYLAEAIESVLAQTHPADKVIVIDDGSTDDSLAVARSFEGITVVAQKNAGVCASRNRGVEMAATKWVAFLDQDDAYLPEKLAIQLRALRANPNADICVAGLKAIRQVGYTDEFKPEESDFVPPPADEIGPRLYRELRMCPGVFLMRRSTFLEVGGFELNSTPCEDWNLLLRLEQAQANFVSCPEPVLRYRIHSSNNSNDGWKMCRAELRTYDSLVSPRVNPFLRPFVRRFRQSGFIAAVALVHREQNLPHLATMLRSLFVFPLGNWMRYKITAHMLLAKVGLVR
jgi:glycosyltransferase involved in cell wall biosynthesis